MGEGPAAGRQRVWKEAGDGRQTMQLGPARCGGAALARRQAGQSTVEYALVLLAFLASILALGALWDKAHAGGLLDLALRWASHSLAQGDLDLAKDVLLY